MLGMETGDALCVGNRFRQHAEVPPAVQGKVVNSAHTHTDHACELKSLSKAAAGLQVCTHMHPMRLYPVYPMKGPLLDSQADRHTAQHCLCGANFPGLMARVGTAHNQNNSNTTAKQQAWCRIPNATAARCQIPGGPKPNPVMAIRHTAQNGLGTAAEAAL